MKFIVGFAAASMVALAINALSASAALKPQTITFLSVKTTSTRVSTSKVVADHRDFSGKKVIGHDAVTCHIKGGAVTGCDLTIWFAKGTISASSVGPIEASKAVITGGSGAYAGAHGTGSWVDLNKAMTRTQYTLIIR